MLTVPTFYILNYIGKQILLKTVDLGRKEFLLGVKGTALVTAEIAISIN